MFKKKPSNALKLETPKEPELPEVVYAMTFGDDVGRDSQSSWIFRNPLQILKHQKEPAKIGIYRLEKTVTVEATPLLKEV